MAASLLSDETSCAILGPRRSIVPAHAGPWKEGANGLNRSRAAMRVRVAATSRIGGPIGGTLVQPRREEVSAMPELLLR